MTYHIHVKHSPAYPLSNRVWLYVWLILAALTLATLVVALEFAEPLFSIINALFAVALIIAILTKNYTRQIVTFLKIDNQGIEYFCAEEDRCISIAANEITHITTRFCELNIHTRDKVHSLNMNMIRQEKKRWEIKEMIRQLANHQNLSATG